MKKIVRNLLVMLLVVALIFCSPVYALAETPIVLTDDSSLPSITSLTPYNLTNTYRNDVSIPLPEYQSHPPRVNWDFQVPMRSRFHDDENACIIYGYSDECDGFARYAHDRFWHIDERYWGSTWSPSHQDYKGRVTFSGATGTSNSTSVEGFFSRLHRGAFIRYLTRSGSQHSIFFDNIDDTGIWVYECNQDAFYGEAPRPHCGVAYQKYTFDYVYSHYPAVLYYVNHTLLPATAENAIYHTIECGFCEGYIRQQHNITIQGSGIGSRMACSECGYLEVILNNTDPEIAEE